jgi:hypothetical protein
MEILALLNSLALALVIINSFTIRVVKNEKTIVSNSVSILIPMRNEQANVEGCLSSVIGQRGLENFEVIALDDHSKDATKSLISTFPVVKIIAGTNPPDKWLGKLWACQQLAEASTGEYLVFLDADVRLSENAVASSIAKMSNWDFYSPYPRQIVKGFIQRIFQPLLQWSWLVSVPLLISQRFSIKSMAVANGQFLIIKRNAYLKSGGHASVKSEVLDDLMLARKLLRSGFKGGVGEASAVASCHMYGTGKELIKGYQKSLWKAFGSIPGTLFAIFLLFITGVLPLLSAVAGSSAGLIAFGAIVLSRVVAAIRTGGLPNTALLHPIAISFLIGLIVYSWFGKVTKTLTWRDRLVA